MRNDLRVLRAEIEAGTPVVGLEPSCVSVFRDEMVNLMPDDEDARRLKKQTFFFAEFLTEQRHPRSLPKLGGKAAVHGHCHHKSLKGGMDDERKLLEALGMDVQVLQTGCCGLAGSFGFERGEKYRVSQAIGELDVFPKVRALDADTVLVGDGFSCREQIGDGTARRPVHVAEVAGGPSSAGRRRWRRRRRVTGNCEPRWSGRPVWIRAARRLRRRWRWPASSPVRRCARRRRGDGRRAGRALSSGWARGVLRWWVAGRRGGWRPGR